MKRLLPFFIGLLALFSAACGGPAAYSPADFTREVYTPVYASGFDIRGTQDDGESQNSTRQDQPCDTCPQGYDRTTLITIRNPWQGAGDIEQRLLVLRNGEKAPAGFDGQAVQTPVRRVVCMSSSHVAMFDVLGQSRRIKGVSGIDYLSNAYVQEHRLCGEIRDVGYDTNIDFELLSAMRPDIVLLYGVTGENSVVTGKLRELNIPYIYIGDYMEQSPLGKAEWLVLVAELCDLRDEGVRIFTGIAARYNTLRTEIAADSAAARPRVMLNTPYRDTWFMPSSRSYMIRLVTDAGGAYIYTQNDSDTSMAVDLEEAYLLAADADVWINTGACNTLEELTAQNPRFAKVPAVRNRRVWNNNRRQTPAGGSDFWESGVVRPDVVLRDLQQLLRDGGSNRTAGNGADSTYYYKRLE